MKRIFSLLSLLLAIALVVIGCGASAPETKSEGSEQVSEQKAWVPDGTIEIIAPAAPGGGWDLLCRTMEKTLSGDKIVDRPIIITNKPGGGGATGWTYLNKFKGEGTHLAATSTLLLTNEILGSSELTHNDFTPLAMLQSEGQVIAVSKDSPFKTGKDFLEALKNDPQSVKIGVGVTLGNDDHMQALMLAKAYGVQDLKQVTFVVFPGGGGEQLPALMGGHIQAITTTLSEVAEQYKAGNVRILGVSTAERPDGDLSDVPTWKEQGVDFTFDHWRGVMGPAEMTPEQIAYWEETLEKMVNQPSWKESMKKMNMNEFYLGPDETKAYLDEQREDMYEILKEIGMAK